MNCVQPQALCRQLQSVLPTEPTLALAKATGFCRRLARKISPSVFLVGCCCWAWQCQPSSRLAAVAFGLLAHTTVSKQAAAKRFGPQAVEFMRQALQAVLARTARLQQLPRAVWAAFRRVLVQDSTVVALHPSLAAHFAGSANPQAPTQAQVKIQVLYEVLSHRFVQFWVTTFCVNDQQAAPWALTQLQPGDLLIRDLGYFVLEALRACGECSAFFLSRLRLDTVLYDAPTGQPLDLLGRLRREGRSDLDVLVGTEVKLPARLVAVPVAEAVANERRRKARHNRDRRLNPSAKRLALLGWDIFLTNVGREVWGPALVCRVYGLRWRIEIVFKSWKSYGHLEAIPRANAAQVLLYARLLLITLLLVGLDSCEAWARATGSRPALSLLKVTEWFGWYWQAAVWIALGPTLLEQMQRQCDYHCRYEQRRRLNYMQKLASLS